MQSSLVSGMVGTDRFELPTCRLGGGRSIHLSYVPTPNYILILNYIDILPTNTWLCLKSADFRLLNTSASPARCFRIPKP